MCASKRERKTVRQREEERERERQRQRDKRERELHEIIKMRVTFESNIKREITTIDGIE